ncbi:hypothetical protein [Pseudomonas aeruginosa]|nr:hypothetical protein [Pseudomonas aeruginosa]
MKRNVFAAILLGMATTLAVQASFADESSLMENRMVQLNQHAIEQAQQQQATAPTASDTDAQGCTPPARNVFLFPATLKSPAHAGLLV